MYPALVWSTMAATGAKPVRAKILKAIRARISYNGSREFLRTAASGSDARGGSPRKGTPEDVSSYGSNSTIYINKCINEQKIKICVFMPPANWMNLRLYRLLNMPILSQE